MKTTTTIETTFARSSLRTSESANEQEKTRRWGFWIFLCAASFALYGSLMPFEFQADLEGPIWQRVQLTLSRITHDTGRIDFFSNVCLFVPIGLGSMAWLTRKERSIQAVFSLIVTVMMAAILSLCCEAGQVYLPGRSPSWVDVYAQLFGTVIGGVGWLFSGSLVRRWISDWEARSHGQHRIDLLLQAYFVFQVLMSLFPLDVTIHPVELYQKLSRGRINVLPFVGHEWNSDLVAEMLFFGFTCIPYGALAARLWMPQHQLRSIPNSVALGALLVISIEVCQLFVFSRFTNATQVVMGTTGVVVGVLLIHWLWPSTAKSIAADKSWLQAPGTWVLAGLAYAMVPAFFLLWPFSPVFDGDTIKRELQQMISMPMATLMDSSPLQMSTIILRDLLLFFPQGLLFGAAIRNSPRWKPAMMVFAILFIGTTAVGIEVLQTAIPSRVADVTNILLGTLSGVAGIFCLTSSTRVRKSVPIKGRI